MFINHIILNKHLYLNHYLSLKMLLLNNNNIINQKQMDCYQKEVFYYHDFYIHSFYHNKTKYFHYKNHIFLDILLYNIFLKIPNMLNHLNYFSIIFDYFRNILNLYHSFHSLDLNFNLIFSV